MAVSSQPSAISRQLSAISYEREVDAVCRAQRTDKRLSNWLMKTGKWTLWSCGTVNRQLTT